MLDFEDYNTDNMVPVMFEKHKNFDYVPSEEIRLSQLDIIQEYAEKYGLKDAAKHAVFARKTKESPYDLLKEIGFDYDDHKVYKKYNADQIYEIPSIENSIYDEKYS